MDIECLNRLLAEWARLGVMFCVPPASQTPDVERLLLGTARHGGADSRLFTMAAAWLSRYRALVDGPRLARLVRDDMASDDRPAMGLLLETAGGSDGGDLNDAIAACGTPGESRPLFDVFRERPAFAAVAEREATELSRKWGRWLTETRLRTDALRPYEWIIALNPSLVRRSPTRKPHVAASTEAN
ncbi:MAG TPA: hypothetical protein VGI81_26355 [Tepidisphaeraceae bacterium]|jgi:hypothetical protein